MLTKKTMMPFLVLAGFASGCDVNPMNWVIQGARFLVTSNGSPGGMSFDPTGGFGFSGGLPTGQALPNPTGGLTGGIPTGIPTGGIPTGVPGIPHVNTLAPGGVTGQVTGFVRNGINVRGGSAGGTTGRIGSATFSPSGIRFTGSGPFMLPRLMPSAVGDPF